MKLVHFVPPILLLLAGCSCSLADNEIHIKNAAELIQFSNGVNSGNSSLLKATVLLDNDIEFSAADNQSEQFYPIGKYLQHVFEGVFDGQGHAIKNLAVNYTNNYVGLFGAATNITVKNVILDATCSMDGTYTSGAIIVGGFIGQCESRAGTCTVENSVNMAAVSGYGEDTINVGGIIGRCAPTTSLSSCTVRNSANYGTVAIAGIPSSAHFGGIVGHCFTISGSHCYVQNCLNYGKLQHNGIAVDITKVGGIIGSNYNSNLHVENSLSGGRIVSAYTSRLSLGSVVGYLSGTDNNEIVHCAWTSAVDEYQIVGEEGFSYNVTIEDTELVELNDTELAEINAYAESNGFDKWFMLHLNGGRVNELEQDTLIVSQRRFPDPVKEGSIFKGWFLDERFTMKYDPENYTAAVEAGNVYAKYAKEKSEMTSSKATIIALSCVLAVAIIVIVVLAVALGVAVNKLKKTAPERERLIQ